MIAFLGPVIDPPPRFVSKTWRLKGPCRHYQMGRCNNVNCQYDHTTGPFHMNHPEQMCWRGADSYYCEPTMKFNVHADYHNNPYATMTCFPIMSRQCRWSPFQRDLLDNCYHPKAKGHSNVVWRRYCLCDFTGWLDRRQVIAMGLEDEPQNLNCEPDFEGPNYNRHVQELGIRTGPWINLIIINPNYAVGLIGPPTYNLLGMCTINIRMGSLGV